MRGPWTSGGIEANYGIIGHTPNCATPVDYRTEKKSDGSVSCYIGTFDKLTQTYWTIDINLPSDKAYFTTRSTWHNGTSMEQPYYTWMNVGMPAQGNLEFVYPGTTYIGHEGEFAEWKINAQNKKDISFYNQNDFGTYKSYHVFGKYTDFFGAFYHDINFGMGHYSLYDEKPGKKIWIWGLSRQGMIWEKLLTDANGQYVEIQSGRLFNQSSEGSMLTPFKNRGFAPYATDDWTEYWFPVKGTDGMVSANPYAALNVQQKSNVLKWSFSPLQNLQGTLVISAGDKIIVKKDVMLKTLSLYKDSVNWSGDLNKIKIKLGQEILYDADPEADVLARPLVLASDFNWESPYALYTLGKEAAQGRDYQKAESKLLQSLEKDPYYLPALSELAVLQYRKMDYAKARATAIKALSIDTYEPASNFVYGLTNLATKHIADAKDAFGISSASPEYRSASFTELAKLYLREGHTNKSYEYAKKAIDANGLNVEALQLLAVLHRINGNKDELNSTLLRITSINPLSHFVDAEKSIVGSTIFGKNIKQEMKEEVFLDLANWYENINRHTDALTILNAAPQQAEILFWRAYITFLINDNSYKTILAQAEQASPALVFPYRAYAATVMEWAIQHSSSWKAKYFLALIHWNAGNSDKAIALFDQCGNPDFAPFHATKATLKPAEAEQNLNRAIELDQNEWRYGKLLINQYMLQGDYSKALTLSLSYQKKFPANDVLAFLTAKLFVLNKQYAKSLQLLSGKTFLPNEGSTEGHQLYRETLLMLAIESATKANYSKAISYVDKSLMWPENLGVGKPYEEDIDMRFEKYLKAVCLEKMKKNAEAKKLYSALTTEKSNVLNANLYLNAMALKKEGNNEAGKQLLEKWAMSASKPEIANWVLHCYQNGVAAPTSLDTDQTRLLTQLVKFLNSNP
jgi:Tfp pilus assembly protein PilF